MSMSMSNRVLPACHTRVARRCIWSHTHPCDCDSQCAVIKQQLTRMLPGISVFLDVDE